MVRRRGRKSVDGSDEVIDGGCIKKVSGKTSSATTTNGIAFVVALDAFFPDSSLPCMPFLNAVRLGKPCARLTEANGV